ncbi:MAG: gliding motility-associated C-terminal domain-containing protein [Ferruginibacter sp.]
MKNKLLPLLMVCLVVCFFYKHASAEGRGSTAGLPYGAAAEQGVFSLYGYAQVGEKIDWRIARTLSAGGSDGNWVIKVYSPAGLVSTCTINSSTIGTNCTNAKITITAATAGIWTLVATPSATNPGDAVSFDLSVYTSANVPITGRVYTYSLHGVDKSTAVEADFTLYYLNHDGFQYSAVYRGMNGINYTIVSDKYGVRTAAASCTSSYKSVSYSTVGISPVGPDASTCGNKNKIFFSPFSAALPTAAPRFNITAGSGQVQEPLKFEPLEPTISIPVFARTVSCLQAGTISFDVANITGTGFIYIDVNNNGIFTDAADRIDTVPFVNGSNTFSFNGLDGLGNTIPIWQAMNIKIAINRIGENHFVMWDIEVFGGGIEVTRLNGSGAPDKTLFWNDTQLSTVTNCSLTSAVNGTAGINSSGGVHGWNVCGSCSPFNNSCSGTNGAENFGSWGNRRLIDNWAYITAEALNQTIYVAPLRDTTSSSICSSQLPFTWRTHVYNAAGSYNDTVVDGDGCNSIATLLLTVKATSTSTTNTSVCPNQLPYSWNSNTYNAAGSYNVTLVNAAGCDSVATLIITVKATSSSITNVSVCPGQLPYSWNSNSYNAAGSYNVTLMNAAGCDSVATLNLTVKATSSSSTNISVCPNQLPYSWNSNSYNAAGSYNVTLMNAAGCDSVATLNLTVKATSSSITNVSVCPNQLPYSWNSNTYNAAGSYNVTLVNAAGCDSVATLNLTVKATSSSITNTSVCPGQLPYSWNSASYNAAGSYNVTLVNAAGCDSVATLNLTVKAVTTSITNTSVCPGQLPYLWNSNSYNAAGSYNVTLVNAAGCDSVATLNLVVKAVTTSTTNVSVCPNQLPYSWNSNSYNAAGSYNVTLVNAAGCDSVATLIITVKATSSSITNVSVCPGQLPYSWNSNSYNAAGSYNVTLVNAAGCDSVATLILKIQGNAVIQPKVLSGCSSVIFEGVTYSASTVIKRTIKGIGGCDSVYNITSINIASQNFELKIAANPNPATKGQPVKIMTSSLVPYTVTAWLPANIFMSQNSATQAIIADTPTLVRVIARSDAGCIDTAYISLAINPPSDFYIPNAFTPNGDGNNDYFSVYGTSIKQGLLRVYNQWGQLVFETTNIKKGWNGVYKGVLQPVGVYAYVVFAEMYDATKVTNHGFLNLIR